MKLFVDLGQHPLVILLIIVGVCGLAALIAFVIYRRLHPKLKVDNEKPNEDDVRKEELDRILMPIEDEETAKAISEYKEKDD